ncbi:2-succinyl-5-enolpyruvyl-6-hydroxy-3-cyclohexene-1-carboxylic-acid synthase [Virgibacillus sp. 179-BFC.A HS]|uniref:2-succinyl-5-enolpyruvyl-6-hydroxy-3-cyclohexene-1-carboxylate synthase n=1 Tax=Tigheibacillus jepli TaxID=3035914 RepID=A0ABU5CG31_9BACI|nr:2-succinyl-5-enolpyruvyl-6-hydroxy-3-cyclohexene-1-carboxylic-acid synthase [Virgibacillus sp. 179-BFC.A HS]MDY0405268.1 2-succinyl-5-enolpyruvyl-6-hydroxy-3-cyclohexene-1-carboxylic-acid synthase [Virgibacillus sp. 179-BFC.A HS]
MSHTERLTRYVAEFVDEMAANGIENVVISPGSRSTPLAMTFVEHEQLKEWIVIDERSAAFFALGLAKKTKKPVALLCSSGTATANYFPAIVEAKQSRVPLIVLTADRPHELRDVGAPQAIDQIKMYGNYVKWFHEMALPEDSEMMLDYVRSKAAQAIDMATEGNPGPVQLNFPFREPLVPDFTIDDMWGKKRNPDKYGFSKGEKVLAPYELQRVLEKLAGKKNGLIVCGPQTDIKLASAIFALAKAWGIPVLADPLSQLRSGKHDKTYIIETYDAFLRDQAIRDMLDADFIIRFGAMPVSKPYLFYLKEQKNTLHFVVEAEEGYREPTGKRTHFISADPATFCEQLARTEMQMDVSWLRKWVTMNEIAEKHLQQHNKDEITEGSAVYSLVESLLHDSTLFTGNSMAVRDVDSFLLQTDKQMEVLANRGANGIDGVVSTAAGAAASGNPVTLLIGDLSFFHDMNGLLAVKHYQLNVTVLLINNNGGGIFSFLPQASEGKYFEALFGTPLNIDFKHAVKLYGGDYCLVENETALQEALAKAQQQTGLSVVEVRTDRTQNAAWHQKIWDAINQEIKAHRW